MELSLTEVNKKTLLMCFVLMLFCCFFSSSRCLKINGTELDRLALVEFKSKLIDPTGVMNSWNDTTHVCNWYGVTCGRRHRRVTMLNLQSSLLVGLISPSIGNLSFLRNLQLNANSLNGNLPPELGRLRRLRNLILTNNSIGGTIPTNISGCSNLIELALENNDFVGEIPIELGLLANLQFLAISINNMIGTIPPSIGNLTFLSQLLVSTNNFVGSIPDSFGKLRNLNVLVVPQNQLSGVFPPSIMNLSSLYLLDLGTNQFYGTLPSNLGTSLPNLQIFRVGYNLFNGSIPSSIANASNLGELFLLANQFTGGVPSLEKLNKLTRLVISNNSLGNGVRDLSFISSLINATNLQWLEINVNNFEGVLPESISNLSSTLIKIFMGGNRILGHIPVGIENLIGLEDFRVVNNRLSGSIPENIGKLQSLQNLPMEENMFSGNIPSNIGNLTRLIILDLSYNNFQGQIPESLQQCQQLLRLDLTMNNLSGEIPTQVFMLSSLTIYFGVRDNQLSGTLPKEIGNFINLGILDISGNMLHGKIPDNLGSCTSLETLYMQGNLFQGSIPASLSSLKGLKFIDLSRNNLSGEIPEYFASFQLQQLNLSYNDFQGMVPIEGIFKNANVVFVYGNNKLCGGIPELKLPICDFKRSKKKHPWRLVIAILCAFVGVILLISLVYVSWYKKEKKQPVFHSSSTFGNFLLHLSYQNLLEATNGFSSENLVGTGSYGSVYRGIVDGGTIVAIKVLNLQHQRAIKSFIAECEALGNIKHRNLVKILTTCSLVDNHGNDFKAIVYEFMANGSLEDWLHPPIMNGDNAPQRYLNFSQRLDIAIHVAFALDYLHHYCHLIIVHCDLKPSNVLLDHEMVAHVGDFGLTKFLSQSNTITATTQSSSSLVRGTIGYACPEYGMTNEVSTYGDVYSFGILLLEMLTGKRPTDDIFKAGLNLHRYCKEIIPDRLMEILDPTLTQELFPEEKSESQLRSMDGTTNIRIMDALISLFALGIFCSTELPRHRPNITDVATKLCAIRNRLCENSI